MGASGVLGFLARKRFDESITHCDVNLCKAEGVAIRDDAVARAKLGTYVFIGGAAATTLGLVMIIASPKGKPLEPTKTAYRVGVGPGTMTIEGTF